ncbi:NUDIX hydrolase [Mesorhizobium sp. CN2-181]|uniref:NUDIX hydrolase n=1 Tax=Mesorhizobium yinganensis TaxID=3157707 RepID=UPI0032B6FACD
MPRHSAFSGAKIALICEGELLVYKRDEKPGIPFPGMWDLPGGGREGNETPAECAIREAFEEFGLAIEPATIIWERWFPSNRPDGLPTVFLVAELPAGALAGIVFGGEGERWEVMPVARFLAAADAVAQLRQRLADYLACEREPRS